ncbi:MAG: PAC2 family protein [Candidatus Woesearchaeota archaeon]
MALWKVKNITKTPKLKNPILIEGLPGIANVGKVAVDFIVDKLGTTRLFSFSSHRFPHSVFVNEKNLVELPSIELHYKKHNSQDLLFLVGDIQPIDEESCYEFCEMILDLFKELGGKELITLGGIGLGDIPKKPKVYCTATSRDVIKKYGTGMDNNLYGVVGPIMGVTGLLIGLAPKKKISGIAMLAETYGHPMYIGVKGAREILKILKARFKLKLKLEELDKEIETVEKDIIKRSEELSNVVKKSGKKQDMSYIG